MKNVTRHYRNKVDVDFIKFMVKRKCNFYSKFSNKMILLITYFHNKGEARDFVQCGHNFRYWL